ncbi:rab guanine nucleotide exchange factor Sec2p [[Candida] anglica]
MSEVEESLDVRLTREVTSLSTNLVTAEAKSLEMEEKVLQLRKENQLLKTNIKEHELISKKYALLVPEHAKLKQDFIKNDSSRKEAEDKIAELQGEVEDLTASLFDEANKMVSNASRETYNFKIKNGKLQEEIQEKNTIIENLQDQLKDLKQLFFQIEDEQKLTSTGTPKYEKQQLDFNVSSSSSTAAGGKSTTSTVAKDEEQHQQEGKNLLYQQQLDALIYSPTIRSIRFDLIEYHQDFKPFIYAIIKPNYTLDLTSLKTLKYFRKIWSEELENSIPIIPIHSNFMSRWSKGKSFWNLIVDGKAVIEPISGVNETYKLTYKGKNSVGGVSTSDTTKKEEHPPIATKEPCSFCGENKDDILEHARLYSLRLLNPDYNPNLASSNTGGSSNSSNSTATDQEEYLASYPLCNYCLIKLRNICDFFAKIRLIHSNVFKLKQKSIIVGGDSNNSSPVMSSNNRFNRLSGNFNESAATNQDTTKNNEQSRLPPTSINEFEEEAKLMKLYMMLVSIRAKIFWSKIGYWDNPNNVHETNLDEVNYEAFKELIGHVESHSHDVKDLQEVKEEALAIKSEGDDKIKSNVKESVHSEEDEVFADTTEEFEENSLAKDGNDAPIRRKSSSKQFKKKMDTELDQTLAMLQESLEPESK